MSAGASIRTPGVQEHAANVFEFVLQLLRQDDPGSYAVIRGKAEQLMREFDARNDRARVSERVARHAGVALAALLDEVVMNSNWGLREEWMVRPLAFDLYDDISAGESFYTRLAELRREEQPKADELGAMEVFATALALGFRGDLDSDDARTKVQSLMESLLRDIERARGGSRELSAHAVATRTVGAQLRTLPLWMVGLGLFLVVALFAVVLQWMLSSTWDEVAATLTKG